MRLGRDWIEAHVPQRGDMCLLDEVLSWDSEQALCRSATHRLASHPLRAHQRLGSACAIEYAAQAASVHGALCSLAAASAGEARLAAASGGMLASVRTVELLVDRLDTLRGDLLLHVRCIQADAGSALYAFAVGEQRAAGASAALARGRLTIWRGGLLGAEGS